MNMSQLAKLAGVSVATVSRTFNQPEKVNSRLRNQILEIAQQNNYVYNATAADLKRRKSNTIGVLFPTTVGPLFADTLTAVHEESQKRSMSLIFGNTKYDKAEDPNEFRTQNHGTMSMALAAAHFLDSKGDYTIISVTPIYKTND